MTRAIVLVLALGYSVIRYGLARGESIVHWPGFIGNKALAFAAVSFLGMSVWGYRRGTGSAGDRLRDAVWCATAHGLMSTVLLKPSYLAYLFTEDGRLNAAGELALLGGGLGLALLWSRGRAEMGRVSRGRDLAVGLVLAGHVLAVGVPKWGDVSRWSYGLVPISLLSFVVLLVAIIGYPRRRTPDDGTGNKPVKP